MLDCHIQTTYHILHGVRFSSIPIGRCPDLPFPSVPK
nr:MAG TPA: hypothetical protein [Caudoviricetes sp.]